MRRTIPFLMSLALVAGCAAAVAEFGFGSVDADDDDRVSRSEFGEFLDDVDAFPRYDDDDDGTLDREEYREAVDDAIEADDYFRGFDRDRSDGLSEDEFRDGIFGVYDADRNDSLNESEFEAAVAALAIEL